LLPRCKGGADRAFNLGPHLGWLALNGAAYRPNLKRARHRRVKPAADGEIEGEIDGLERDRGEAGLIQYPPDPVFARKRERSGVLRTKLGKFPNGPERFGQRQP